MVCRWKEWSQGQEWQLEPFSKFDTSTSGQEPQNLVLLPKFSRPSSVIGQSPLPICWWTDIVLQLCYLKGLRSVRDLQTGSQSTHLKHQHTEGCDMDPDTKTPDGSFLNVRWRLKAPESNFGLDSVWGGNELLVYMRTNYHPLWK